MPFAAINWDGLVGARRHVLHHVDAGLDSPLEVEHPGGPGGAPGVDAGVDRNLDAQRVGLFHGGCDFFAAEHIRDRDQVGALVELFAHRLSPGVCPVNGALRVDQRVVHVHPLGWMPTRTRDLLAGGEKAGAGYAVLGDEVLEAKRDVAM